MQQSPEIRVYRTVYGRAPFEKWMSRLQDVKGCAKIRIRIDRLRQHNFGDHRFLSGQVFELRINFGPEYRIYLGKQTLDCLVILLGGDKSSQPNDVVKAKEYWEDYQKRL